MSRTKRRRNNPPDFLEADGTVREALSSLKTTLDSKRSQEDDDCDLYGKNLAKKLRRLPVDERLQLMYDIDGIFMHRRQLLKQPQTSENCSTTYVPSPSQSPQSTYSQTTL